MKRQFVLLLALAGACFATMMAPQSARAQEWPQRAVKFILPFGPGSSADTSARIVADKLQQMWGKPIVVEPRPGGDAMIAINAFIGANDDHTFFFGPSSSFVAHKHRYAKLNYDRERDMIPIAQMSATTVGMAVPAASNIKTLKDFVDHARANPGRMNVAAAPGTTEMMLDVFIREQNLDVVKVPYRDIVQGANDVAIGRLQALFAAITIFQAGVQGNAIRLISVSGPNRTDAAPGVATAHEQGFPRLGLEGLMGVFASRSMAEAHRRKFAADYLKVVSEPDVIKRLGAIGQVHAPGDSATFMASIAKQQAEIDDIARLIGMKPQ